MAWPTCWHNRPLVTPLRHSCESRDPEVGGRADRLASVTPADVPILCDTWYEKPYTHYAPALVAPPEGADAIEEWQLYWELARRLESPIRLAGGALPMAQRPEKEEVLEMMLAGSRIPFAEIRKGRGGQIFEQVQVQVAPADADCEARLALAPEGICEELREVGASTNRLVDNARHFDPITGMARQSAIPVNIRPAPPA